MIQRAFYGPAKAEGPLRGLGGRELAMMLGLIGLLLLLGVYPQPVLDTSAASKHGVQQWLAIAFSQLISAR
jgi:NADH-quinone oxidoreductase subunit M